MKKEARTYERKQEFRISGKDKDSYADILLPVGELEIHVTKDRLECSQPNEVEINGTTLKETHTVVEKGDQIIFGDYMITFYEKELELIGDLTDCTIRLIETQGETKRFEGFPYYKRSPRIIYRIEGEKIEVKAPPEKKTLGKGGILQIIVPTLSTTLFTVFMGIMLKRGPYVYMSVGMTVITLCFSIQSLYHPEEGGAGGKQKAGGGLLIFSLQNAMGKSRFRVDVDLVNYLHIHFGLTNRALRIHRKGVIESIIGMFIGINDVKDELKSCEND